MRHTKHRFELGVKKEHRDSLLANLTAQLLMHGKIRTTLAKAKALRPFAEKIITLAKKASNSESLEQKLHFRRLALARVRNERAVRKLFVDDVGQFLERVGGYTRIYKLMPRVGDGAPMGLIEYVTDVKEFRRKSAGSKIANGKKEPLSASAEETTEKNSQ